MVWKFSTINRDEIYMTILIMRRFSIFNGTYLFLKNESYCNYTFKGNSGTSIEQAPGLQY